MVGSSGGSGTLPIPVRALIDTNVVLDLLLAREPWASEAKPIWDARDDGRLEAYLPASVLTDIYYICRKQIGADPARAAISECLRRFIILAVDRGLLEAALHVVGPDFEDDVQIVSAQASGMHLIVTRNAADFVHGPIPTLTPSEVVARLSP
ncbi:MAG TPA: PIN domain-containing protein [Ktedonobacterales bacterium]|nr:PIN domain-containing protein [Ktedonobacterales bacterium]